ncbi:c-type cytochrome [Phenylobacterium sp.]|uniref:c-type cytochrome n=1 Tax=Phenylobacterium sp. TaxID=1871053 RepID=UPI002F94685B
MFRSIFAVAALSLAASPALAADGGQLFNMQCKMCHTGGPMGPSLTGVAGAKIASKEFNYSPALKGKSGTWTDANLDAFLKAPAQFAPGTRMMVSVPSEENRAAIIAYLKTLK